MAAQFPLLISSQELGCVIARAGNSTNFLPRPLEHVGPSALVSFLHLVGSLGPPALRGHLKSELKWFLALEGAERGELR